MSKLARIVGALLVIVGVGAFLASGSDASPTSLIPALLGVPLVAAGLVGPALRRHAMHAAAAVAVLGLLGSLGQLIARPAAGSEDADIAMVAGLLTLALCGLFAVAAVRSFRRARSVPAEPPVGRGA